MRNNTAAAYGYSGGIPMDHTGAPPTVIALNMFVGASLRKELDEAKAVIAYLRNRDAMLCELVASLEEQLSVAIGRTKA